MPSKSLRESRCAQVPEAPSFYPTEAEFTDPLAYIAQIRPQAEQYGACKIVPPSGWKPPFVLDRKSLKFNTRIQSVHELQERSTAEEDFDEDYHAWLKEIHRTWKGPPMVNGREVDLYKLFRIVLRRGGYEKVSESKAWKEICKILQVREKSGNAAYTIRQLYQKHLLGYEERCNRRADSNSTASPADAAGTLSNFDKMVAASNGKEDIEVLGAVAALMDVPANECAANTRFKLDLTEAALCKEVMRVPGNIHTMVCELCKGGHCEEKIVLCDKCDRGCHIFCLHPPLSEIPSGMWVCPLCVAEEVDNRAFREGKDFTLEQFEKVARDFKIDWFGGEAEADKATLEDIEHAFWNVVENGEEPVEVLYGADIDTSRSGSGFPVRGGDNSLPAAQPAAQYADDPWNLNNLPRLEGSLLKHLGENIAGVTLPWMYMGMLFSSFCWHIEDHMFYSINYHQWGDPKRWYSVPASAAEAFEAAFRAALPELFEKQPDVLFHLVTMLSPRILQAAEVPVYGISQGPGEFVVTFPCAYHGGFNMGLNCAEAVNFAPADWLRFGPASTERFRTFRRQPILSHSWLLLKIAEEGAGGKAAFWGAKELRRVVDEETEWRYRLQKLGCFQARRVEQAAGLLPGATEDSECAICRSYLHLSGVECKCCPKRFVCMRHADHLCDCPPAALRLAYRHSLAELNGILDGLTARVPPELKAEPGRLIFGEDATVGVDAKAETGPVDASMEEADPPTSPLLAETQTVGVEDVREAAVVDASEAGPPEARETPQAYANGTVFLHPPIPRKRERKANKSGKPGKRQRLSEEEEEEERPQVRLTRAAIKAEEEAQDTMDVLTALTGLADMGKMDREASPEAARPADEAMTAAAVTTDSRSKSRSRPRSVSRAGVSNQPLDPAALSRCFDVAKARADVQQLHRSWLEQGSDVLEKGGARAADVEALLQQSQQFMWATEDVQAGVQEVVQRLKEVQAWSQKVHSYLKTRPSIEDAEAALSWIPAPVAVQGLARFAEGVRAARSWLAKVSELGQDKAVVDLRALEALSTEGQRLPVALPQLKVLKERLVACRQLLDAVKAALPLNRTTAPAPAPAPSLPAVEKMRSRRKKPNPQDAGGNPPAPPPPPAQPQVQEVTIEWLRILRAQSLSLKVRFPELDSLNEAISAIEAFQAKIKEALQVKPNLPTLRDLAAESENVPATVPEMQRVRALLAEAKTWLNKSKNVTQSRTALKKMREVLHSGLRLGSELPQVDELRQEIRRREWEDHAKKALNNKQTLTGLVETLEDAASVGAADTELAQGLQRRLEQAKAWDAEATKFFTAPGRAPLFALEELVASGNALGVKMERLVQANQALMAAVTWARNAEHAASTHEQTPAEARPSLAEVEALLAGYQGLVVALHEAESLEKKRSEAQAWASQAKAVLSNDMSEDHTHIYKRMVRDGWAMGVQMGELVALQDCLAALEWMKGVRKYNIIGPRAGAGISEVDQATSGGAASRLPAACETDDRAGDARAQALDSTATQGTTGPAVSMREQEQTAVCASVPGQTAGPEVDGAAPRLESLDGGLPTAECTEGVRHMKMTVDEAQQLVEEGEALPVDQNVLALLRHNLELVHQWEERLSAVSCSQAGESGGLAPEILMPLVEEARRMALQPESLPALEDALTKAAVWQARAARLFKDGEKPLFSEVAAVAMSGRELLVQAEASTQVSETLELAEGWRESSRKLIAKRNSGHRLGKCIKIASVTLEMALEQLDLRMKEESARPIGASDGRPPLLEHEEEEVENERDLYCVCQQPYNVDTSMISCDECEEWYHCRCIGISQTTARSIKKYSCPLCLALRGAGRELEQALSRTRQTRRPTVDALREAVDAAGGLPCKMEEAEALTQVLDLFQRWERLAVDLLRGHESGLAEASDSALCQPCGPSLDAQGGPEASKHEAQPNGGAAALQGTSGDDMDDIDLGSLEALDAVISQDIAAELEARRASQDAAVEAPPPQEEREEEKTTSVTWRPRLLSVKTLSQLLKSALSLEVTVGSLQASLLTALKQQRWRQRAEGALKPNTKYTVEGLVKLVNEGETIGINMGSDCWGRPLARRTDTLNSFLERVHVILDSIQEHDGEKELLAIDIRQAEELLSEGRSGLGLEPSDLPRDFDKELTRLEEACKLYCLCQQPYNEERPMLGCDYCQEWFHYDCVGLRTPSDDEDDEDVAPEDYRCPQCCRKAGEKYPQQERLPQKSLEALGLGRDAGRDLATSTGASRLHELLTPSQAQALGEAQQAMLSGSVRSSPQPAHSWLLSVLAQQQRLRPTMPAASAAHSNFSVGQPTTFASNGGHSAFASSVGLPLGMPGSLMLPAYQSAAAFLDPQPQSSLQATSALDGGQSGATRSAGL